MDRKYILTKVAPRIGKPIISILSIPFSPQVPMAISKNFFNNSICQLVHHP